MTHAPQQTTAHGRLQTARQIVTSADGKHGLVISRIPGLLGTLTTVAADGRRRPRALILTPDQTAHWRANDGDGCARIDGVEAGQRQATFPERDRNTRKQA
jgi:hypothetical protein